VMRQTNRPIRFPRLWGFLKRLGVVRVDSCIVVNA
jgi:hypothetical protein